MGGPATHHVDVPDGLTALARDQAGVVTRAQALSCGLSRSAIQTHLVSGRWQRIHPGVYATFSGPLPRRSQLWAAVLKAGPGAVLSHDTAAELVGLAEPASAAIHVCVPWSRTPARIAGVVLHRTDRASASRHPTRLPPQTRIEDTVVDLTQLARRPEDAVAWLARAVGSRRTTAQRLSAAIARRGRLRWRRLLCAALADVAAGCHSLIEVRYLRDVERAHALPAGQRQSRAGGPGGSRYHDVEYKRYRTRVELDGRAAHPEHERWRDMRRDNDGVVEGTSVLRYGLGDVSASPCQVAAQLAKLLRRRGWSGTPRSCGRPDCAFSPRSPS